MPTRNETGWVDPDDAPPLTREFFERAEIRHGDTMIRRGRPPSAAPKKLVSVRLDADLLDRLRASGPGWQSRLNEAVRAWLDR
ncbi:BrnA antitoxin family protein [Roseomonas chloroacetimidivorans]|uniref:BrnA antitoxin family protein n=1 Tax=Roseomonas chloroacetimidivorans TaxID=1766656 RepID=UPI003C73CBE3